VLIRACFALWVDVLSTMPLLLLVDAKTSLAPPLRRLSVIFFDRLFIGGGFRTREPGNLKID
jgi:hypothetical protein